jgi:hypothetical protein
MPTDSGPILLPCSRVGSCIGVYGVAFEPATPSHTPCRPRPSASRAELRRRLALQTVENRVRLSEPVLGVLVSLSINLPSAGLEAVRWVEEHSNGMPRICWQTIFYLWMENRSGKASR